MLPTSDEYRAFMLNTDPKKREQVVDVLLGRKEFVEMWVMKWSELLMIKTSQQISYKAMLLYYNWLQSRIQGNMPIDTMVQELLGSKGGTFTSAATNYYQNETDTLKVAENVAQVFMGMRIQCAQCHNHPFDRWTMDDYYGFANFFSQIGRKPGEDPRETIVFNSGGGDVKHPVGGGVIPPKFLGGIAPRLPERIVGSSSQNGLPHPRILSFRRTSSTLSGHTSLAPESSTTLTMFGSVIRPSTRSCSKRLRRSLLNTNTTLKNSYATSARRALTNFQQKQTRQTSVTIETSRTPFCDASVQRFCSTW